LPPPTHGSPAGVVSLMAGRFASNVSAKILLLQTASNNTRVGKRFSRAPPRRGVTAVRHPRPIQGLYRSQ
jgi:hypothetical protein